MTKSFYTHLSTIFLVHILILMGTWQLSQSEYVMTKVNSGVLKLQVASSMMMTSQVQKKVERVIPVNPDKPRTAKVKEEKVTPVQQTETSPVASSQGSEFGTAKSGKTDVLSVYKAELRAMIDKNKYYPAISKRLGQTGTVVVAFTLLEDGHIIDVKIDKPSRYDRLNDSALEAVKKVERFRPIPKEVGESKMAIKVPVKFITI
jgi:protein TonB